MQVAAIQSNYIPWRGYFDFIRSVDLFIFYDDVQYSSGSWRNRNRIKTASGVRWLTVPVHVRRLHQRICDTEIDYGQRWQKRHRGLLTESYKGTPFFPRYAPTFFDLIERRYENLSELNVTLIRWLMGELRIDTRVARSEEFFLSGRRNERLLSLLQEVGASAYLSGPAGRAYLDEDKFTKSGIQLQYKSYCYPSYPQAHGDFISEVSVLDLLFHRGPESRYFLEERQDNAAESVHEESDYLWGG